MATNLLFAYPQIWVDGTLSISASAATGYPKENVTAGPRRRSTRLATAASGLTISVDLGSALQKTIQYVIVSRADILKNQGCTIAAVEASSDNFVANFNSVGGTSGNFQSKTFYGPRSEDVLFTSSINSDYGALSYTGTYRYWRISFQGATVAWQANKVYLGSWFDMGRDPTSVRVEKRVTSLQDRDSRYVFTFDWEGLTDQTKEYFTFYIADKPYDGVFLYTSSYHDLLLGHRLLHCRLVEHRWSQSFTGANNLSATFEEMI